MNKLEADITEIRKEIRLAKWVPSCVSIVCAIFCRFVAPAPQTLPAEKDHKTNAEASGNTVNVGLENAKTDPQRDWLTVAEVAENEGLSERTITTYITAGRIEGERTGRAYRIPKGYTVQPPQFADNGGN